MERAECGSHGKRNHLSCGECQEAHVVNLTRKCRHFNGTQYGRCSAGLSYHDVHGRAAGCFKSMACFGEDGSPCCDQFSSWTEAEARERNDESNQRTKEDAALVQAGAKWVLARIRGITHLCVGCRTSFLSSNHTRCEACGRIRTSYSSAMQKQCEEVLSLFGTKEPRDGQG